MHGLTEKAALAGAPPAGGRSSAPPASRPFLPFQIAAGLLLLCFAAPLYGLVRLSLKEEIYSHIILIPFVTGYLVWLARSGLPAPERGPAGAALTGGGLGVALLAVPYFFAAVSGIELLSSRIFALWVLLASSALFFLGWPMVRTLLFPIGFLLFLVPTPPSILEPLEIASMHASGEVYAWMMAATQSPYLREGLTFTLPGLTLVVAQECSGIRSSYVLFIVGLLAGHLFLQSRWKRLFLAFFVFPLGIARNAFRILVLSMLTIHWDRSVIDGPLHHRGGPIFFVLSLIPFCLVLFLLVRSERRKPLPPAPDSHR